MRREAAPDLFLDCLRTGLLLSAMGRKLANLFSKRNSIFISHPRAAINLRLAVRNGISTFGSAVSAIVARQCVSD